MDRLTQAAVWRSMDCWVGNEEDELRDTPQLRMRLGYTATDPFAVHLIPKLGVEWVFARSLLDEGLAADPDQAAGLGDVTISPCCGCRRRLRIELTNPNGHAVLWFSKRLAEQFLACTYDLVPAGAEPARINWDLEFANIGAPRAGES